MKTVLYDRHIAHGAKIVPFSGWEMPVQYKGILVEHQTVRERVGLFDVSHMGRIHIRGPDAERLLDFLSTNTIANKSDGTATYTVWCHLEGGAVDDTIVYRINKEHFFIVANGGNRDKDLAHLKKHAMQQKYDVSIKEAFDHSGILALQGPMAAALLVPFLPEMASLKPMQVRGFSNDQFFVSTTGYTGAGGFELFGAADEIISWWDRLLEEGKPYGIQPVGLGARDTLRLEMGYALYGHELSDTIAPSESVSAWTIKWEKPCFLGKESLVQLEQSCVKRHAYGVRLGERGIPRQGYSVLKNGHRIGVVTSGSFSPTIGQGVGLILVDTSVAVGDEVMIEIRGQQYPAEVSKLPFLRS